MNSQPQPHSFSKFCQPGRQWIEIPALSESDLADAAEARRPGVVGQPMDAAIEVRLRRWLAAGEIVEEGESYGFSLGIVTS